MMTGGQVPIPASSGKHRWFAMRPTNSPYAWTRIATVTSLVQSVVYHASDAGRDRSPQCAAVTDRRRPSGIKIVFTTALGAETRKGDRMALRHRSGQDLRCSARGDGAAAEHGEDLPREP